MIRDNDGWMVNVRSDVLGRFDNIVIGRNRGDRVEYLTRIHPGSPAEASMVDAYAVSPPEAEFTLPRGVLQAIADHIKPGPGSDEVKRLEEALALERARVEKLIDAAIARGQA